MVARAKEVVVFTNLGKGRGEDEQRMICRGLHIYKKATIGPRTMTELEATRWSGIVREHPRPGARRDGQPGQPMGKAQGEAVSRNPFPQHAHTTETRRSITAGSRRTWKGGRRAH